MQSVRARLELQGSLLTESAEGQKTIPVHVDGQFIYDEKLLEVSKDQPIHGVRHYQLAKAKITYRDGSLESALREERRIVAASVSRGVQTLFSPLGPLSHGELELIDLPASSTLIGGWLPTKAVSVGEVWHLDGQVLATLLGLDAVNQSDLQCKLDRIEGQLAVVHAQGNVSGAVGGVASQMRVAAKFNVDLDRKTISWFAMSVQEKRSVGKARPGMDVTVRIQLALSPLAGSPYLDDGVLGDLTLTPDDGATMLEFVSEAGGFEVLLNRNWHVMVDRQDVSVLRLIEQADMLGQCNITALPALEPGKAYSIGEFQQDVKKALDEGFGEFTAASESLTNHGIQAMRIVATGQTADIPIQWIYYHLSSEKGQRASCVFTCPADLSDRFGATDEAVISSFQFRQLPAQPGNEGP
ncbi:MAG: hypothetical protein FJ276_08430 [Planctomycetes bacterium]|nr:hypothetical protein [Planctomycetota bacterium]